MSRLDLSVLVLFFATMFVFVLIWHQEFKIWRYLRRGMCYANVHQAYYEDLDTVRSLVGVSKFLAVFWLTAALLTIFDPTRAGYAVYGLLPTGFSMSAFLLIATTVLSDKLEVALASKECDILKT